MPQAGPGDLGLVRPDWAVSPRVKAAVTTRRSGVSVGPHASFNLATHVDDDINAVLQNRALLRSHLQLLQEPGWLRQVHGTRVVELPTLEATAEADASVSRVSGLACVVLTADCLPVLLCDEAGTVVAAAHAGWRGLLNGVLENTVAAMACAPTQIRAWLGPAIGPAVFEVGAEVRNAFLQHDASAASAFVAGRTGGKFFADIYALARLRLRDAGVSRVEGGGECTYTMAERYYSFRREPLCGRMASLIWIED
jgi:YfiH family protein